MLYVLHGKDVVRAREKAHALLDSLFAKKPDAHYFHVTAENYVDTHIEELAYSQGLFEQKYIVVFDHVFEDKEMKKEILSYIKEISDSEHIFIFLEGSLDKTVLTKLGKYAAKVQEFSSKEIQNQKEFNIFALTDAFGARDRKTLWVLYQGAKQNGITDEEIHGILFWQTKSMLLAEECKNAKEAGLNPFVFKKSKNFIKNYSKDELKKLSASLISLYHNARRGKYELATALERFVLNI